MGILNLNVKNMGSSRREGKTAAEWSAMAFFEALGVSPDQITGQMLVQEAAERWAKTLGADELPGSGISRREAGSFLSTKDQGRIKRPKDWDQMVSAEKAKLAKMVESGFVGMEVAELTWTVGQGQKSADVITKVTFRPATAEEIAAAVALSKGETVDSDDDDEGDDSDNGND